MGEVHFDSEAFYAALDGVRRSRDLTWRQVARETGVNASTLTRMARGSHPDLDTVASLAAWAALDPASFFPAKSDSDALSAIAAYIHRDPALTKEAAAALEQVMRVTYSQLANDNSDSQRYRK